MVKLHVSIQPNDPKNDKLLPLKILWEIRDGVRTQSIFRSADNKSNPSNAINLSYDFQTYGDNPNAYTSTIAVYSFWEDDLILIMSTGLDIDYLISTGSGCFRKQFNVDFEKIGIKVINLEVSKGNEAGLTYMDRHYDQDWFDLDNKSNDLMLKPSQSITPYEMRAVVSEQGHEFNHQVNSFQEINFDVTDLPDFDVSKFPRENLSSRPLVVIKGQYNKTQHTTVNPLHTKYPSNNNLDDQACNLNKMDNPPRDSKESNFAAEVQLKLKIASLEKENHKLKTDMKNLKLLLEEKQNEIMTTNESKEKFEFDLNKANVELMQLQKTFADYRDRVEKIIKYVD